MICLSPCNRLLPLNLEFNLLIFSCKATFSFWTWYIFSSFVRISFSYFSIFSFNPLISPSFRLTCDISWTISSMVDEVHVIGAKTMDLVTKSTFSWDDSIVSFSNYKSLAL
jgi:hypothetical protein